MFLGDMQVFQGPAYMCIVPIEVHLGGMCL